MPYESQPFQNKVFQEIKKKNKDIKTIGYNAVTQAFPSHNIYRAGAPDILFVHGLSEINHLNGYWVNLNFDVEDKLIISGEKVVCQETVYSLRDGYNLISFCCEQPLSIDNLPLGCTRIIGESNASIYSNNNWIGGLNELEPGRGYWIHCDESVDFNWNCSE